MTSSWRTDSEWKRPLAATAATAESLHRQAVCAEEAARGIDAMRTLCEAGEASWRVPLARAERSADVSPEDRRKALERCAALGLTLPDVAIGRTVKPAWKALPMKPPGTIRGGER